MQTIQDRVRLTVNLERSERAIAKELAHRRDRTIGYIIREAIREKGERELKQESAA